MAHESLLSRRVDARRAPSVSAAIAGGAPLQVHDDLIYDVGLHDGSDTAYYLARGFRVLAIEANSSLAEAARQRFAAEIADGRLELLNVGIAAQRGIARFWICDDHDEWSSFERAVASRKGCAHHAVDVPTVPFGELLAQHGVPYYCKIDIEGSDHLCLEAMRRGLAPAYMSMELMRTTRVDPLAMLCELGYRRFKIVDQLRFCAVEPNVYRWLHAPAPVGPAARAANSLMRARTSHDGWRFAAGSSGAIGPATPGRWLDASSVQRLWGWVETHVGQDNLLEWFDLHAAL
jgi:FkbM family methyltransferase